MSASLKDKLPLAAAMAIAGIATGFFLGRGSIKDETAARLRLITPALSGTQPIADRGEASAAVGQIEAEDEQKIGLNLRWQFLRAQPATPQTEDEMRACLMALGAQDSSAALALAAEADTPRQRGLFRNAALHGWATRDSRAAAEWVLVHVRSQDRRAAVEAIAAGAVVRPVEAIQAFQRLIADDPLLASEHGNALVSALAHVGQYEIASEFAAAGATQFRATWLSNVYHSWAICQPDAALVNLEKIADTGARREALSGLFAGWGSSDPAGLVVYAQKLPVGESRLEALKEGLMQWVYRDSAAASDWMDKFDPSPDLDTGAAALAVMPALIEKKPDIAASWAESISDPELRASTLLDLIRLWAEHDAAGARKYANTSPALSPETRALALSTLQPSP